MPQMTESISEYESSLKEISVVGRLAKHVNFWEEIGASPYIVDIVKHGYQMPLNEMPKSKHLSNNASSRGNPEFVRISID